MTSKTESEHECKCDGCKCDALKGFVEYRKRGTQLMRPYIVGEDMSNVGVPQGITPQAGGMIAIDKNNLSDKWYVSKTLLVNTYVLA